ncbi:MAG TPA: biotin/lipoyl-binding protein, partial [Afipia sp.]
MPSDDQQVHLSRRKMRTAGIVAGVLVILTVVTGIVTRENGNAKLREWTDAQAIPTVAVGAPNLKPPSGALTLPGRIEANYRAPIFGRVSGYLKAWYVDIGAPVKAGQLLAEVDAPDLDQQLLQSRADLANAEASSK